MTDKKPVDNSPESDSAVRREAAKEARRAKALKANLRRRKGPPVSDQDAP